TPADDAPAEAAPKTRSSGGRGAKKAPAKDAAAAPAEASESAPDAAVDARADAPSTPDAAVGAPTAAVVEASLIEALGAAPAPARRTNRRASSTTVAATAETADPAPVVDEAPEDPQDVATRLLERALRLGHDKDDDAEWLHSSAVKTHMRRMDPSFSEKALGYRSFSDFVKARESIAELEETGHERLVRLRE
ncbi:OST-HTH/LOTUS domain-containing protein, partial [Microbacterium sp.]|uniref:OST-HTH/LOTUS domain-containing protein n=1 Tax=Microbacterium sp. TaxID=51671 RepID=UPI002E3536A5